MAKIINMADALTDKKIQNVCKIIDYTLTPFAKENFYINEKEKIEFLEFVAAEMRRKDNLANILELNLKDRYLFWIAGNKTMSSDFNMIFTYSSDDAFQNSQFLKVFNNFRISLSGKKGEYNLKDVFCEKKFRGEPPNLMEIPSITFIM